MASRHEYEVVVGNIGTVYSGGSSAEARRKYRVYTEQSKSGVGRAGGEDVTLMRDGEPWLEFWGSIPGKGDEEYNPRRRGNGRSFLRRGVSIPPNWEPRKGDVLYVSGYRATIGRVFADRETGEPYIWFRRELPDGTLGMSVRNVRQAALVDPGSLHANPIPLARWKRCQVRRLPNGRYQVKLT